MIIFRRIGRVRIEVFQEPRILADRHFILIDRKRRQVHFLPILVNEFSAGNSNLLVQIAFTVPDEERHSENSAKKSNAIATQAPG